MPTPAFSRAVGLSALLLVGGLFFHRGELVALSAPLVVGTSALLRGRRQPAIEVSLVLSNQEIGEGEVIEATITVSSDISLDIVNIELESELAPVVGGSAWSTSVVAGEAIALSVSLSSGSWGRRSVGPTLATSRSAGLLRAHSTVASDRLTVTTLPSASLPIAGELAAHAIGFAGAHRSRLLSLGSDMAGVRQFRSGDPLRRINWHASARSPELQVTSTFGERSATVLVAIDATWDVRSSARSSLDVAVRAAGAIGQHFLDLGDLVGFAEVKSTLRILRPAGGVRQLSEARRWLSSVRAFPTKIPTDLAMLPVRAGHLVIALSPMVDDASIESLLRIRRRGCALVVVDVLPPDALPDTEDEVAAAALRLWRLERSMLIARLVELGIPVASEGQEGGLGAALDALARVGAGPHLVTR